MTANQQKPPKSPRPQPIRSGIRAGLGNKLWDDDWLAPK
jgi:hypothetical protein